MSDKNGARRARYVHALEMRGQTEVISAANENTGVLEFCEGLLYTWDSARTRWGVYTVADGTDLEEDKMRVAKGK